MFGFRVKDTAGNTFSDDSILQASINTYTNSWNEETQQYDTIKYKYEISDCAQFIDGSAGNTTTYWDRSLVEKQISMTNFELPRSLKAESFRCPDQLRPNFIDGYNTDPSYSLTEIQFQICTPDNIKQIECADEATIRDTVN